MACLQLSLPKDLEREIMLQDNVDPMDANKAYKEGKDAFYQGFNINNNPYEQSLKRGWSLRDIWMLGYYNA